MKETRKHNYVCGYLGDSQCIYGKEFEGKFTNKNWIDPITLFEAKQYAKKLNKMFNLSGNEAMKVFKLVEVKE